MGSSTKKRPRPTGLRCANPACSVGSTAAVREQSSLSSLWRRLVELCLFLMYPWEGSEHLSAADEIHHGHARNAITPPPPPPSRTVPVTLMTMTVIAVLLGLGRVYPTEGVPLMFGLATKEGQGPKGTMMKLFGVDDWPGGVKKETIELVSPLNVVVKQEPLQTASISLFVPGHFDDWLPKIPGPLAKTKPGPLVKTRADYEELGVDPREIQRKLDSNTKRRTRVPNCTSTGPGRPRNIVPNATQAKKQSL